MKTTVMICDNCQKDITYAGGQDDYIIELKSINRRVRPDQSFQTAMMVYPQFAQPLHFCGDNCLKEHVSKIYKLQPATIPVST